MAYIML